MELFDLFLAKAITGGSSPSPGVVLIDKEITENGTYTAKEEGADGYSEVTVDVPSGIPIDGGSLTPLVFGIDSDGFYFSDNTNDETPVAFGRDSGGIYCAGGAT